MRSGRADMLILVCMRSSARNQENQGRGAIPEPESSECTENVIFSV